MNNAALNQVALNSVPASGGKQQTYTTDGRLVVVRSKTYTTDGLLQAHPTRVYTTDAVLQGGSTKFYSADAVLVTPYNDYGSWHRLVGNNLTQPIDPNRLATWTTYNRPTTPWDGMAGRNTITGKLEYYDAKAATWKNYDGTAAP